MTKLNAFPALTRRGAQLLTAIAAITALAGPMAAQAPPPIPGVTGTLALEGTVVEVYAGAHTVAVKAADGVRHVFHFTKDLAIHGSGETGETLDTLRAGTSVAIHYTMAQGDEAVQEIDRLDDAGLKTTEGMVTRIDRRRREIRVRFDNGTQETLKLTNNAAAGTGRDLADTPAAAVRIAVFYTDADGRKVVHYFKRVS